MKQSAAMAAVARVTTRTQANLRRFERDDDDDDEGERDGGRDLDECGGEDMLEL